MKDSLALSLGAAWIFKKEHLDGLFKGKLINSHGTRLPRDKGGGGFTWQILRGNRLGVCLLHLVDEGVDAGDIIDFEEFLYPPHCRVPADYQKVYVEENTRFLEKFFRAILSQKTEFSLKAQPSYLSLYFPRLNTPLQSWINWDWPALQLERFICGFDAPYEGARTHWKGALVKLRRVFSQNNEHPMHPYQRGLVLQNNGKWLTVGCDGGELIVSGVENEQGRDILKEIQEGDRFVTAAEDLAGAKERVFYTPKGLKQGS